MMKACGIISSILLRFWRRAFVAKIPKRKNEGVECEGFKEHKKIKTSLRKRIDLFVGEARYADRNILKRR